MELNFFVMSGLVLFKVLNIAECVKCDECVHIFVSNVSRLTVKTLVQLEPILGQRSISILPENIRKPFIFRHFREYRNGTLG